MTRTGDGATREQRAAAEYLGSLDDALAQWVQSVGPIDAYDPHLPVTVRGPLEWFAFAVTSRQLSRASSLAIYHRLVARLGGAIAPEAVISTDEQTLRDAGLSHQKAWTIRALAERMYDGGLDVEDLATMSDAELLARLITVPGIGPSSAQRFMLHYLRRPDIFPAGDPTVREAITALDQLVSLITPKAAEERSDPWHPYRSYATSYLWGYVWEQHPVVAKPARH